MLARRHIFDTLNRHKIVRASQIFWVIPEIVFVVVLIRIKATTSGRRHVTREAEYNTVRYAKYRGIEDVVTDRVSPADT